jgi:hypothetical protein
MRIRQLLDVLLFGLMGEPVLISQLIGSDFVVYRSASACAQSYGVIKKSVDL